MISQSQKPLLAHRQNLVRFCWLLLLEFQRGLDVQRFLHILCLFRLMFYDSAIKIENTFVLSVNNNKYKTFVSILLQNPSKIYRIGYGFLDFQDLQRH